MDAHADHRLHWFAEANTIASRDFISEIKFIFFRKKVRNISVYDCSNKSLKSRFAILQGQGSRVSMGSKNPMLVPPREAAGSLKPPMIPNGLEMKKMQTSRASFASSSKAGNNRVVPVIPDIEIEVCILYFYFIAESNEKKV